MSICRADAQRVVKEEHLTVRNERVRRVVCLPALALFFTLIMMPRSHATPPGFDYLSIEDNKVVTTNGLNYSFDLGKTFRHLGEFHHQQKSRRNVFNVSIGAFSSAGDLILIRAETLDNESGVLDYGDLENATLSGLDFAYREQCLPKSAKQELTENVEAVFVEDQGFDVKLPFLLLQYLIAAPDGNAEVAINIGRNIATCDAITDSDRTSIQQRLEAAVSIEHLPPD